MDKWNKLDELLQEIRDALDAADGTPMGKLSALLDGMATKTDIAISTVKELREAK